MTNRLTLLAGAALLSLGGLVGVGCSSDSATSTGGNDASTGDAGQAHDGSTADAASPADGGVADTSSNDGTTTNDGATPMGDAGVICGNTTCNVGDVCCGTLADGGTSATLACMSSCPDGGVTLACDSPAQCTGAAPICCADLAVGPGTPPQCPFQSGAAACKSACVTQVPQACPGTGRVQLCRVKADCTDPSNANCCTFSQGGQSATFCIDSLVANFGTCHP